MNQSGTDIGVACFAQKCAVLNQVHFTDPTTSKDDIVYESPTSYLSLPQGSCCVQSPLESLSLAPHLVTGYQSPLFCFVCIALRYRGTAGLSLIPSGGWAGGNFLKMIHNQSEDLKTGFDLEKFANLSQM